MPMFLMPLRHCITFIALFSYFLHTPLILIDAAPDAIDAMPPPLIFHY